MPDPRDVVEHLTIAGFIRRAPHRFHFDDITRFGDKVRRMAESLQISYLTTIDTQLGMIRLLPVPLMIRVYQVMAQQLHWPPWTEPVTVDDRGPAAMLRCSERARKNLQSVAELAEKPEITEAMNIVLKWLDDEARRLSGESPVAPPETAVPPPLRAI